MPCAVLALDNMVSVIIPTHNAGERLRRLLSTLMAQSTTAEIVIVDTSSSDNTIQIATSFGVKPLLIRETDFDHGGTRTLAGRRAKGDILVYLTQDVLLADVHTIRNLTRPLYEEEVAVAYGRQLPHTDASAFAAHLRQFNYPATSCRRTLADKGTYGIKTAFLSDSFAAYRRSALEKIGWFKENLIAGEDTYAGAKLLLAGYSLLYVADAVVYHSHNYTAREEFKRYFDVGVFHATEQWIVDIFGKAESEGIRYVLSELDYLMSHGRYHLFFEFIYRSMMKYAGYRLGRHYRRIAMRIVKKISMNRGWWEKGL
jgi:rhamnosyltransferase